MDWSSFLGLLLERKVVMNKMCYLSVSVKSFGSSSSTSFSKHEIGIFKASLIVQIEMSFGSLTPFSIRESRDFWISYSSARILKDLFCFSLSLRMTFARALKTISAFLEF